MPVLSKPASKYDSSKVFPNVRACTINVDGLSLEKVGASKGRGAKIIKIITFLLTRYDIVNLQETKIPTYEAIKALTNIFPGSHVTASCGTNSTGDGVHGVATLTSVKVTADYNITKYYSSSTHGKGHIVSNLYVPKDPSSRLSKFRVTNVYLKSGVNANDRTIRRHQIREISSLSRCENEILGGDLNFTTREDQRSNKQGSSVETQRNIDEWNAMLDHRNLEEVKQDAHTCYRSWSKDGEDVFSSSQIDRWYCTSSYAQLTNSTPTARVVYNCPGTITSYPKKDGRIHTRYIPKRNSKQAAHITDHVAVGLWFAKRDKGCKADTTFPGWVMDHPQFRPTFLALWEEDGLDSISDPNEQLAEAERISWETSQLINDNFSNPNKHKPGVDRAINLYNAVYNENLTQEEIVKTAEGDEEILSLYDSKAHSLGAATQKLRDYIDREMEKLDSDDSTDEVNMHKPSRVERLAKAFPRMRQKVTSLQEEGRDPTDDPRELTRISANFWRNHWSSGQSTTRRPSRLFQQYQKRILTQPTEITREMVEEIILTRKHSSPGPDKIPFRLYQVLSDVFVEIFYRLVHSLLKGEPPPENFNAGTLILIPKKDTGWIDDTRPIVISNAANRIVASIIRHSITPSIAEIIDPNQNGFLPSRKMEDNIEFFNENFYKALEIGDDIYSIILFDFAKAFDSCSHGALLGVLEAIGLPESYVKAITSLFRDAHCQTSFPGAKPEKIDFKKGIKQGCPLSPLLFIILMDVLTTLVKEHTSVDFMLYADDSAAGSCRLEDHLPGLKKAFRVFASATGLDLNLTKSVLLTTAKGDRRLRLRGALDRVGWSEIKIVGSAVYLGAPIGDEADNCTAFLPAVAKFRKRLSRYLHHKDSLSCTTKATICNVWFLPLFAFPQKFWIWPEIYQKGIYSDLSKWFSKYNSIATKQLSTLPGVMGPPVHHHDIYAMNMACLASNTSLDDLCDGCDTSMRIKVHRTRAVRHIQSEYNIDLKDFVGKAQGVIYDMIIKDRNQDPWYLDYVTTKLTTWGSPTERHSTIISNYAKLPNWAPHFTKLHFIYMTHNALHTASRLSKLVKGDVSTRRKRRQPHVTKKQRCYLCDSEDADCSKHLYQNCVATLDALQSFSFMFGLRNEDRCINMGDLRSWTTLENEVSPITAGLQVIFNFAVWRVRENIKNGIKIENKASYIKEDILDRILLHGPHILNKDKIPQLKLPQIILDQAERKISSYGSAGKRTKEQEAAARNYANRIKQIPANSTQIWTDGSSFGNPGPAGAGTLTIYNDGSRVKNAYFLGHGTN